MRGEGDRIMGLDRKHYWERHGTGHWGYGVALDVLALERRVEALEKMLANTTVCVDLGNRTPQPTLTAEERVAIELAAGDYLYHQDPGGRAQWIRQTLRGLLERTK